MPSPRATLDRLLAEPSRRQLGRICTDFDIECLAAFGSAVDDDRAADAHDLDIAFTRRFKKRAHSVDLLALLDRLVVLSGCAHIDLLDLDRASPVARAEALLDGYPLFEAEDGVFALLQMRAFSEREDTAWLRRLQLDLLANQRAPG